MCKHTQAVCTSLKSVCVYILLIWVHVSKTNVDNVFG